MHRSLAGFVLALSLAPAPAAVAQTVEPGRWFYGSTEHRSNVAWALAQPEEGEAWVVTVACPDEGGEERARIDVDTPQEPAEGATGTMSFRIGGSTYTAEARAEAIAAERVWVAPLTPEITKSMASGFTLFLTVPDGTVTMGLTGSARALNQTLDHCDGTGDGSVVVSTAAQSEAPETALLDHIAAACDPDEIRTEDRAVLHRDLTSDGLADHLIDWSGVVCIAPDGSVRAGAGRCEATMCDADIWVAPALPPDPPSDTIRHSGLDLWPERHVPIRTRSEHFTQPLDWRWGGEEFLGSIPAPP